MRWGSGVASPKRCGANPGAVVLPRFDTQVSLRPFVRGTSVVGRRGAAGMSPEQAWQPPVKGHRSSLDSGARRGEDCPLGPFSGKGSAGAAGGLAAARR
jgi:hypothetical protein